MVIEGATLVEVPATRYATSSDGVHIAYQVYGIGSVDLVFVNSWASNVELIWEESHQATFLKRLGSFCRVILFDKRGTGMSDPVPLDQQLTLDQRMDDMLSVMNAVGAKRAAVLGFSDGGPISMLFTVTHPDRVSSLVLWGATPRITSSEDWPWGMPRERGLAQLAAVEAGRLEEQIGPDFFAPSVADDPDFRRWWSRISRLSASPAMYLALMKANGAIDVRASLPDIRVPTLVMHRTEDLVFDVRCGRYMAEQIPGARLIEFPGSDHWPWIGEVEPVLGEIEEFLTGTRPTPAPERALAAVLFADIVSSTLRLGQMGDRRWSRILDTYEDAARHEVERFGGRVLKTIGDGMLVLFDGPGRAIAGARALITRMKELGLELRAGIHAGEVELRRDDASGIAVHIARRVADAGAPGELIVTRTVEDLVAGSGVEFEDRGLHNLRGVPGEWRLQAVMPAWEE